MSSEKTKKQKKKTLKQIIKKTNSLLALALAHSIPYHPSTYYLHGGRVSVVFLVPMALPRPDAGLGVGSRLVRRDEWPSAVPGLVVFLASFPSGFGFRDELRGTEPPA